MTGVLTRVAALTSIGLSVVLMLMFGWQGATCIDEWTMAACNLAIGATLMLGGSGAFSLDNALLARKPALAERRWFRWMSGALPLPVDSGTFQKIALAVFAATVVFNVATYNYYRGSVITPFHGGPVSPSKHHLALADGVLLPDGAVRFHAYLDGGTPEAPSNVMTAVLKSNDGSVLEQWDGNALSHLRVRSGSGRRWGQWRRSRCPPRAVRTPPACVTPRRCSCAPSTAIHSTWPSDRDKTVKAGRFGRSRFMFQRCPKSQALASNQAPCFVSVCLAKDGRGFLHGGQGGRSF
jgi:hypothetical protein